MEADQLAACPICAKPVVEIRGAGDKFHGAYAVEARVHTFEDSEYRMLFVCCPHCRSVLAVVRAD